MEAHKIHEIHDTTVDPEQIMTTIRQRIQEQRALLTDGGQAFPQYGVTTSGIGENGELSKQLQQLQQRFAQIETTPNLAPSPATRIPLIGRVWGLIRSEFHNVILFYVNRAMTHQIDVNRRLVKLLGQAISQMEAQKQLTEDLQQQLDHLNKDATPKIDQHL